MCSERAAILKWHPGHAHVYLYVFTVLRAGGLFAPLFCRTILFEPLTPQSPNLLTNHEHALLWTNQQRTASERASFILCVAFHVLVCLDLPDQLFLSRPSLRCSMDDPGWKRMNRFVNSLGLSWRSSSKCTKMLVYGSLGVVVLFVIGALILSDEKKHLLNSKVSTSLSTLRFLARTTPGRPSAVQPPPLVKQALPDYNIPMSALRVDDIHVCVAMSTLLDTGGTEQWLWGVVDSVYHKPPFVLHAMQVNDYWSHAAVKDIHSRRIKFNPSSRTMVQECDVIIQTGTDSKPDRGSWPSHSLPYSRWISHTRLHFYLSDPGTQPIPTYNFLRPVPRVLVIHGSKGCQWTEAYAAKASSYSEIVAVSRDATFTVPEEQRARVKVIPSIVHRSRFQVQRSKSELLELWNLPQDKKILMYVGRISREKNPQYFVDVVAQLGPEWIGVLVGPLYFQEWMPVIKDPNRVFFVGTCTAN